MSVVSLKVGHTVGKSGVCVHIRRAQFVIHLQYIPQERVDKLAQGFVLEDKAQEGGKAES